MKIYLLTLCMMGMLTQQVHAQKQNEKRDSSHFPRFDRSLLLEAEPDTTANVSFSDFDGDGHLDILLEILYLTL